MGGYSITHECFEKNPHKMTHFRNMWRLSKLLFSVSVEFWCLRSFLCICHYLHINCDWCLECVFFNVLDNSKFLIILTEWIIQLSYISVFKVYPYTENWMQVFIIWRVTEKLVMHHCKKLTWGVVLSSSVELFSTSAWIHLRACATLVWLSFVTGVLSQAKHSCFSEFP